MTDSRLTRHDAGIDLLDWQSGKRLLRIRSVLAEPNVTANDAPSDPI
jgi:hypothetical protein